MMFYIFALKESDSYIDVTQYIYVNVMLHAVINIITVM